jgi:hypothetical protein
MQGEQREAQVVYLDLQVINVGIAGDHVGQWIGRSIDEGVQHGSQPLFRETGHREEMRAKPIEFVRDRSRFVVH